MAAGPTDPEFVFLPYNLINCEGHLERIRELHRIVSTAMRVRDLRVTSPPVHHRSRHRDSVERSRVHAGIDAMTPARIVCVILLTVPCVAFSNTQEQRRSDTIHSAPLADHHQHLFSPELAALMSTTPPVAPVKPRTAADLIEQLDAAGIKRAVVLSTAYIFEQPSRHVDGAGKLRRENDWTSRQVAQFPDRLIGFCGLNPLKDYALEESRARG